MSTRLEPVVPASVRGILDEEDLRRSLGLPFLLLTSGDDGWPHLGMLGVGEIVTHGPQTLGIALWSHSSAATNLGRSGRATLSAVVDATSFSIRLSVTTLPGVTVAGAGALACFRATVCGATADRAPYADLESGVRFRLHDEASTLARWRATRDALSRMLDEGGVRA